MIEQLEKYCIFLLIAAVSLGAVYVNCYFGQNYTVAPGVNSPLAIGFGWAACLAVLGCVKRWGNKTNAFSEYMTKRSFGLYVFHYTTLSATAYVLTKYTHTAPVIVYLLTAIAAFGGGLLLNEIISGIPVIRWCVLGIKKEKKQNVQG